MVADGLTKALNHILHQAFIKQLGLAQPRAWHTQKKKKKGGALGEIWTHNLSFD